MTIKEAREKIDESLKSDPEFRAGYIANITMRLFDNFPDVKISFKKKRDYCNDMADKLLDLIFG